MHILLKTIISALIIIFFTKLSTFAMSHSATYEIDGKITFGTVGSTQRQTTTGEGKIYKESSITLSSGVIGETPNDYIQGDTSINNITKMELCAPPKYTYEAEDGEVFELNPDFIFRRSDYTGSQMSIEKTPFTWNYLF